MGDGYELRTLESGTISGSTRTIEQRISGEERAWRNSEYIENECSNQDISDDVENINKCHCNLNGDRNRRIEIK